MLGDPLGADPLTAAIDRLAEHATAALASGLPRAGMWLREQDPCVRLGLDIILGAQRQMIESRAYDALAQIPAVASGNWWVAPAIRPAGAERSVHVVAANGALGRRRYLHALDGLARLPGHRRLVAAAHRRRGARCGRDRGGDHGTSA